MINKNTKMSRYHVCCPTLCAREGRLLREETSIYQKKVDRFNRPCLLTLVSLMQNHKSRRCSSLVFLVTHAFN